MATNFVVTSKKTPVPFYRDLGKSANDLITKGFPSTYKFELTTNAERGMKFVFATEKKTREEKKDISSSSDSKKGQDYIFVSAQVKEELKDQGINFTGTLDSDKLGGELSLADIGTRGLKVTFKGNTGDNNKQDASGEVEYRNDLFASTLGLIWKDHKNTVEPSITVGVLETLSLGANAKYLLPSPSSDGGLDNFSLGSNWVPARYFDLSSFINAKREKSNEFKLSAAAKLYYTHSPNTTFAADLSYDFNSSFNQGVGLKLAANHKFDDSTSVKARVDNTGNVALALSQKAFTNVNLTLGTESNILNFDQQKVGFTLAFSP